MSTALKKLHLKHGERYVDDEHVHHAFWTAHDGVHIRIMCGKPHAPGYEYIDKENVTHSFNKQSVTCPDCLAATNDPFAILPL